MTGTAKEMLALGEPVFTQWFVVLQSSDRKHLFQCNCDRVQCFFEFRMSFIALGRSGRFWDVFNDFNPFIIAQKSESINHREASQSMTVFNTHIKIAMKQTLSVAALQKYARTALANTSYYPCLLHHSSHQTPALDCHSSLNINDLTRITYTPPCRPESTCTPLTCAAHSSNTGYSTNPSNRQFDDCDRHSYHIPGAIQSLTII